MYPVSHGFTDDSEIDNGEFDDDIDDDNHDAGLHKLWYALIS